MRPEVRGTPRRAVAFSIAIVSVIFALTLVPVGFDRATDPAAGVIDAIRPAAAAALLLCSGLLSYRLLARRTAPSKVDVKVLEEVLRLERRSAARIANQLHDTAVQSLVVATYLARSGPVDQEALIALTDQLALAEREVRDVIRSTQEPDLQNHGLGASCQELHTSLDIRDGIAVTWRWDGNPSLPISQIAADLAYRFLQETLSNVAAHSGVDRATVTLTASDHLVVSVRDEGVGFAVTTLPVRGQRESGMQLLSARALIAGASLSRTSAPGHGATLTLRIPLDFDLDQTMVMLGHAPKDPTLAALLPPEFNLEALCDTAPTRVVPRAQAPTRRSLRLTNR